MKSGVEYFTHILWPIVNYSISYSPPASLSIANLVVFVVYGSDLMHVPAIVILQRS